VRGGATATPAALAELMPSGKWVATGDLIKLADAELGIKNRKAYDLLKTAKEAGLIERDEATGFNRKTNPSRRAA
jgi:hypothetical protein